jgi:hypothetical protein
MSDKRISIPEVPRFLGPEWWYREQALGRIDAAAYGDTELSEYAAAVLMRVLRLRHHAMAVVEAIRTGRWFDGDPMTWEALERIDRAGGVWRGMLDAHTLERTAKCLQRVPF